MALPPSSAAKASRLPDFAAAVFFDIRPHRGALFSRRQRQRHGLASVDGALGQQGPGGQFCVADVGADGENGFLFHGCDSSNFLSITPNSRRGWNPAFS